MDHDYIGHDYTCHNHIGRSYTGHNYIGDNYVGEGLVSAIKLLCSTIGKQEELLADFQACARSRARSYAHTHACDAMQHSATQAGQKAIEQARTKFENDVTRATHKDVTRATHKDVTRATHKDVTRATHKDVTRATHKDVTRATRKDVTRATHKIAAIAPAVDVGRTTMQGAPDVGRTKMRGAENERVAPAMPASPHHEICHADGVIEPGCAKRKTVTAAARKPKPVKRAQLKKAACPGACEPHPILNWDIIL